MKSTDWKKHLQQFIKFGLVGVLNNVICLAVYYGVIFWNSKMYLLGNILGFLVSTLNAYILNSRFVFHGGAAKKQGKRQLICTYITYAGSLGISTFLLYIMIQKLHISEEIAPLFSLMVTVPFNYFMNRLWVYKKAEDVS